MPHHVDREREAEDEAGHADDEERQLQWGILDVCVAVFNVSSPLLSFSISF